MRLKCFFSNAQHIQSRRDQTITTSIPVGCITFRNGRKANGFKPVLPKSRLSVCPSVANAYLFYSFLTIYLWAENIFNQKYFFFLKFYTIFLPVAIKSFRFIYVFFLSFSRLLISLLIPLNFLRFLFLCASFCLSLCLSP